MIIVVLICALYWPVHTYGFINFDDDLYVTDNPYVTSGLHWANIVWACTTYHGGHWHPLTWISYMSDVSLFGVDAGMIHSISVVYHAINTVLVFYFLQICFPASPLWIPAAAALLFGVHPMRMESVAWISERKDVLSFGAGILSIIFYARSKEAGNKRQRRWILLHLLFFALSLMAKPTFITMPALLVLMDLWIDGKSAIENLWSKLPALGLAVVFSLIALFAQANDGGLKGLAVIPMTERLSAGFVGYLFYLGKFFLPTNFGIFYPFVRYQSGVGAGAFLGIFAITVWLFQSKQNRVHVIAGWGWFLVSLLPVIGFVQIGGQSAADRWSYLPHIGLLLIVLTWLESISRPIVLAVLGLSIVISATTTAIFLPMWKDSQSIFLQTLDASPDNFMAHTNLGAELDRIGDINGAKRHFEEAYRLNPTYPEAINNLGRIRTTEGQFQAASDLFAKALVIRPTFMIARLNLAFASIRLLHPALAIENLAVLLQQVPQQRDALQLLDQTLSVNSDQVCSDLHRDWSNGITTKDSVLAAIQRWPAEGFTIPLHERALSRVMECQ